MADITWIVMSQPIKALVNTNNLEVYVAIDETIVDFFADFDCLRRDGIEYYSIKQAKHAAQLHSEECEDKDCHDKYEEMLLILSAIEDKVLKAVSM